MRLRPRLISPATSIHHHHHHHGFSISILDNFLSTLVAASLRTQEILPYFIHIPPGIRPVSHLYLSEVTSDSVLAAWSSPAPPADFFILSYSSADGTDTSKVTLEGSKTRSLVQGLLPSTQYSVSLITIQGDVTSEPITASLTTGEQPDWTEKSRSGQRECLTLLLALSEPHSQASRQHRNKNMNDDVFDLQVVLKKCQSKILKRLRSFKKKITVSGKKRHAAESMQCIHVLCFTKVLNNIQLNLGFRP